MKLNNLADLYLHDLRDVYNAEQQILRALPKMAEAASSEELRDAFEEHLEITQKQVSRLESIFQGLGKAPAGERCEGMEGLVAEGEELLDVEAEDDVRDAGLITAAQKVEHYEIAAYGSLRTFAQLLKRDEDVGLLEETLKEEKQTDKKLTEIAERMVNTRAL